MKSRPTFISRQLLATTAAALISATAAATPFDPSQPIGPVMKGLGVAIHAASASNTPKSAALVDTSQLLGELHNPPDSARSFSSIWSNQGPGSRHAKSQLNASQAWSTATNNKNQWIELPIPAGSRAIGIATQGRANANQWVTAYRASARMPDGSYVPLHGQKSLQANRDRNSVVSHNFDVPQNATAIRVAPQAWYRHISLRAALLIEAASCNAEPLIVNGSFEQHGPLNRENWAHSRKYRAGSPASATWKSSTTMSEVSLPTRAAPS